MANAFGISTPLPPILSGEGIFCAGCRLRSNQFPYASVRITARSVRPQSYSDSESWLIALFPHTCCRLKSITGMVGQQPIRLCFETEFIQ